MASSVDTALYICDQAGLGRRLTYRKMFGEFAVYLDGKVVGLICDDELFLKPTPECKAYLGEVAEAPPFPGARNFYVLSAFLDDTERLSEALRITARALPERRSKSQRPKPRSRVAARKPSG